MEKWLEGVLRDPGLSSGERLALVGLYPDADEPGVREVFGVLGDRPVVMQWLEKLGSGVEAGELQELSGISGELLT